MLNGQPHVSIDSLRAVTAVDLETARIALKIGRTKAYKLVGRGEFPCPVFRAGNTWRVPTPGLLELLTGRPESQG